MIITEIYLAFHFLLQVIMEYNCSNCPVAWDYWQHGNYFSNEPKIITKDGLCTLSYSYSSLRPDRNMGGSCPTLH